MTFVVSTEPIDCEAIEGQMRSAHHGAVVTFIGTVRETADDGAAVTGLSYEAHAPMALREFERIGSEAKDRFGECAVSIVHRTGDLSVGEPAVVVCVGAQHRDAAFAACRYAIDQVKLRAPIWKKEHYASGRSAWKS